jgi:hypothetical protein
MRAIVVGIHAVLLAFIRRAAPFPPTGIVRVQVGVFVVDGSDSHVRKLGLAQVWAPLDGVVRLELVRDGPDVVEKVEHVRSRHEREKQTPVDEEPLKRGFLSHEWGFLLEHSGAFRLLVEVDIARKRHARFGDGNHRGGHVFVCAEGFYAPRTSLVVVAVAVAAAFDVQSSPSSSLSICNFSQVRFAM